MINTVHGSSGLQDEPEARSPANQPAFPTGEKQKESCVSEFGNGCVCRDWEGVRLLWLLENFSMKRNLEIKVCMVLHGTGLSFANSECEIFEVRSLVSTDILLPSEKIILKFVACTNALKILYVAGLGA